MPIGILNNQWYDETTLAHDLDIPIEQAREIIRHIMEGGRHPVAYHTHDYSKPEVSGHAIKDFLGLQR